MAERSFNRTAKRAAVPGTLAILILAGLGAAEAGPWLREGLARLLAGHAVPSGLDLSVRGTGLGADLEPWPGTARRRGSKIGSGSSLRLLSDDEAWASGAPTGTSRFVPYAGVGLGAFRLSMNLAERTLGLSKERKQDTLQVFGGLGYALAPNLTTNLEYRALPAGDPAVSLDIGGLAFDLDNPFQDHNVSLKLRYSF